MVAVTLQIGSERITSDVTGHRATLDLAGGWSVSWLPGRVLDRSQATTAMVLAERVAELQSEGQSTVVDHTHPMWPLIDRWAAELGLTGPEAMVKASEPEPCTVHTPHAAKVYDPGPVPEVVEPAGQRRITTIRVSSRVQLVVTENVGNTGRTGLTLTTATGEAITAALDACGVDDLVAALTAAVPVPYVPETPTTAPQPVGGGR